MADWHSCETTHCRAGWVVFLAGEEGEELEKSTSTCFAAMQIYKASGQEVEGDGSMSGSNSSSAMNAEETCHAICKAYNEIPEYASAAGIEMPAEALHELALSHGRQQSEIVQLRMLLRDIAKLTEVPA